MKAPLVVFGLFLLAGSVAAASLPPSDEPAALAAWFEELGPRREGSSAEARVFEALRAWFTGRATIEESGFAAMEGEHSFSRRLWFKVNGDARGELVVVTPTDGSNHRGLAWAVAWARATLDRGAPVSVTFLFTGAERGAGESAGLGSRAFLQDFYPTDPAAVVYLDVPPKTTESAQIELTTESGLFPSPLWMVRGLTEAFQNHGLEPQFTGTAPSLFRLDLPERKNVLAPWFERSLPAILMVDGPASKNTVLALDAFVRSLTSGVPARWDRHYLVFELGNQKMFWSQGTYLALFLSVAGVLLFGYALAGRGRRGSLRVLRTGFWQIPVLFAFLFLALYSGTELAVILQDARGMPEFWKANPLLVWTFKATVAITLYLFLFLPFRRTPLSRDPDFYGQAALVWLAVMVLVAAAFELSFSFYFLWALVCCALFVAVPWRPFRFVSLVLGPLWMFKAAWDVLGPRPDITLTQWSLGSEVAGNVALAVLFFPFLLQINAWHFSGKVNQNRDEGLRAVAQLTVFALATLFLGMAVLRTEPAGLIATQVRPMTYDLKDVPRSDLWGVRVSRAPFLDRTAWTLTFSGETDPEKVELVLESQEPLILYECSFPVVIDAEGHRATIIVGRQPALPLPLRLTLPARTRAELKVRVTLPGSPGVVVVDRVDLRP